MFGRRRVPPNIVFMLSLLLALVCGFVAYQAYMGQRMTMTIIFGILALWFAIDTIRSFSWIKRKE